MIWHRSGAVCLCAYHQLSHLSRHPTAKTRGDRSTPVLPGSRTPDRQPGTMRLAGAEQVVTATKRFGSASYSYNCLGMTELGWLVAGDDDNARRSEFE